MRGIVAVWLLLITAMATADAWTGDTDPAWQASAWVILFFVGTLATMLMLVPGPEGWRLAGTLTGAFAGVYNAVWLLAAWAAQQYVPGGPVSLYPFGLSVPFFVFLGMIVGGALLLYVCLAPLLRETKDGRGRYQEGKAGH